MKHGKRLTRAQKILVRQKGLNPDNWFCERETPEKLVLLYKATDTVRVIYKE